MCAVSYIGDYWKDTFPDRYPSYPGPALPGSPIPTTNPVIPTITYPPIWDYVTKTEFEQLRNEIKELKELLLAAKKFDEKTGQPDCEMETKVAFMKAIAKMVGVDLSDIFGK